MILSTIKAEGAMAEQFRVVKVAENFWYLGYVNHIINEN